MKTMIEAAAYKQIGRSESERHARGRVYTVAQTHTHRHAQRHMHTQSSTHARKHARAHTHTPIPPMLPGRELENPKIRFSIHRRGADPAAAGAPVPKTQSTLKTVAFNSLLDIVPSRHPQVCDVFQVVLLRLVVELPTPQP